jgi:CBS domain-containing protein
MQARDVMTPNPTMCPATAAVTEAAKLMRDHDIGDVLVEHEGQLRGILTDRDIVVRSVAEGHDPAEQAVADVCSPTLFWVEPDADVNDVILLMSEQALRRVPVVAGGVPVGIVSIGDLAVQRDSDSLLGRISAAPANV